MAPRRPGGGAGKAAWRKIDGGINEIAVLLMLAGIEARLLDSGFAAEKRIRRGAD